MSRLRVNRIAPRTGTSVTIEGSLGFEDLHENGPTYDVQHADFGATGDGVTDDYEAIQTAIDLAETNNGHVVLSKPTSLYAVSQPLRIKDAMRLSGTSREGVTVAGSFRAGPVVVIAPPVAVYPNIRTGDSLATGSGSSILFTNDTWYLSLDDIWSTRIDGWTALTFECFFHSSEDPIADGGVIISSSGQRWASDTLKTGFQVAVLGSGSGGEGAIRVKLETENDTIVLTTANDVIDPDTTHHVRVAYDGSNVRIFVDGVFITKAAATGAIVQEMYESFTIGREILAWPEGSYGFGSPKGRLDSPHLNSTALSTTDDNFSDPTAKHAIVAGTVFLCNFDETEDIFVVARNGSDEALWMVVRNDYQPGILSNVFLEDFEITGGDQRIPLFTTMAVGCHFNRLLLSSGPFVFFRWRECFTSPVSRCRITNSARTRALMVNSQNCGAAMTSECEFIGGPYQRVEVGGASQTGFKNFYSPSNDSVCSILYHKGDQVNLIDEGVDHETGLGDWVASCILSTVKQVTVFGGGLNGRDQPGVILDGNETYTSTGTLYSMEAGATEAIQFLQAPTFPALLIHPSQDALGGGTENAAWSSTPQHLRIIRGASVQQAVFDNGNSGTTKTVNARKGEKQKLTATGNCTVTLTMDEGADLELHYLTGAGSFTATFSSVTWVSGSAPTLTLTASKRDIFGFTRTDSVTFGRVIGQNL